jgi:hypothetical protein
MNEARDDTDTKSANSRAEAKRNFSYSEVVRLQEQRKRALKRLYKTGKFSYSELATIFELTRQRVEQIVNG